MENDGNSLNNINRKHSLDQEQTNNNNESNNDLFNGVNLIGEEGSNEMNDGRRSRSKRIKNNISNNSTSNDITVNAQTEEEELDQLLEEHDQQQLGAGGRGRKGRRRGRSQEDDSSTSSGGDEPEPEQDQDHHIDPSLKLPSSRTIRTKKKKVIVPSLSTSSSSSQPQQLQILRSPPADFASNTGNFRALPLCTLDLTSCSSSHAHTSAIASTSSHSHSISNQELLNNLKFVASDYTHITQAIAHQPLAVNPSQQTVELMKKMAVAGLVRGSEGDRLDAFMTEVSNQLFGISQRIDVLETGRFASLTSISNLQNSVSKLETSLALNLSSSHSHDHSHIHEGDSRGTDMDGNGEEGGSNSTAHQILSRHLETVHNSHSIQQDQHHQQHQQQDNGEELLHHDHNLIRHDLSELRELREDHEMRLGLEVGGGGEHHDLSEIADNSTGNSVGGGDGGEGGINQIGESIEVGSHLQHQHQHEEPLDDADDSSSLINSNPISDAANIANAEQLQAIFHNHFATTNGQFAQDIVASSTAAANAAAQLAFGSITGLEGDVDGTGGEGEMGMVTKAKRGRKVGSVNAKKDPSINQHLNANLSIDAKKKGRKPELSRTVRSTMFRMLGLSLSTNASKYHGYTSSPDLPDFNPAVLFDPNTGSRLWRWEWDKTIRQSAHNAAFSMAIQNQILNDRNNFVNHFQLLQHQQQQLQDQHIISINNLPIVSSTSSSIINENGSGLYGDVPEQDWNSLEEAVESAFTNLRRERESQLDPIKKQKKDDHRKKGKKRGTKDEKSRRRKLALTDSKIRGIVAGDIESSMGVSITGGEDLDSGMGGGSSGGGVGGGEWLNILSSFTGSRSLHFDGLSNTTITGGTSSTEVRISTEHEDSEERLEDALDMKYMSSEEEIDTNDPVNFNRVVIDITPGITTSLIAGEKTFSVHTPAWRSDRLNRAMMELDILKPPERIYRRIVGGRRMINPPRGTKDWMIADDWVDLPSTSARGGSSGGGGGGGGVGGGSGSGKGKGKGKGRATRRGTTEDDEEEDEEDELGMDISTGME